MQFFTFVRVAEEFGSSQSNLQPEFIRDSLESNEVQRTGLYTETGK